MSGYSAVRDGPRKRLIIPGEAGFQVLEYPFAVRGTLRRRGQNDAPLDRSGRYRGRHFGYGSAQVVHDGRPIRARRRRGGQLGQDMTELFARTQQSIKRTGERFIRSCRQ
jgi:hypothetical protein